MAIKNFWSLAVDEAIVADKLKKELGNDYQVFFPVNSQLKDIDLIVFNLKTRQSFTVQVKGSRTYDPKQSEVKKFGEGRSSWNPIKKKSIFNTVNKVDFFIIVIHFDVIHTRFRKIEQKFLIIPSNEWKEILKKTKKPVRKDGNYHFMFWINPNKKQVWDINQVNNPIKYSKYLNSFSYLKM